MENENTNVTANEKTNTNANEKKSEKKKIKPIVFILLGVGLVLLIGFIFVFILGAGGAATFLILKNTTKKEENDPPQVVNTIIDDEKDKDKDKDKVTPDTLSLSDEYLIGYYTGGGYGTWYDTVSPVLIIKKDRNVDVYLEFIESPHDLMYKGSVRLSQTQYDNIVAAIDAEKLYSLDPEEQNDICDGWSETLILYDEDELVLKKCGGYMPSNKEFLEMFDAVHDNLPWDEISEIKKEHLDYSYTWDIARSVEYFCQKENCFGTIDTTMNLVYGEDNLEKIEWVDDNEELLRVRIKRSISDSNEYDHKRDYFFRFLTGGKITTLEVDYPSKSDPMDSDRYVYDACDFDVKYEDVNFDGLDDIVISLGHSGVYGEEVYCAYLGELSGGYKYNKSFEEIANYKLDPDNQVIISSYHTHGVTIEEEYIYNPDTEMFEKNRVDTCGLTRSTLKLFEGCATYLPANTDASKGDILSSQDYLDMKDFLYYLDRDEVEEVHGFKYNYDTELYKISYKDWAYILEKVYGEKNPESVRDKLKTSFSGEVCVYYDKTEDCIYMEAGMVDLYEWSGKVKEVKKEGNKYIITYGLYSSFTGDQLVDTVDVTIVEADNKYGYSLVSVGEKRQ